MKMGAFILGLFGAFATRGGHVLSAVGRFRGRFGDRYQNRACVDQGAKMRRGENTGRPLGDEGFVKTVGKLLGRDLLPKRPGRKAKGKEGNREDGRK